MEETQATSILWALGKTWPEVAVNMLGAHLSAQYIML